MAKDKRYEYFAIRNGGECLSGRNLYSGYKEHGESDECFDGEGGHDAMNVYNITGNIYLVLIIIHISPFLIGSITTTNSSQPAGADHKIIWNLED